MVLFETALFDTGKPVMVAPPSAASGPVVGVPATIFWTGTAEAARAVGAALPMLAAAERVFLIASNPGKPTDTSLLQEYLAWQGVKVQVKEPLVITPTAGDELVKGAKRDGAGFLVMGAYTQSRLRQLIYGSVTKHVLNHAELPVLMAN
jgi:nucleotide-binding universal stress UspA family protein